MIILNEVIKWGSIIACIVWPVYIIKKGCITYVIEKRISATESKKNEILWTDWKNDEELKRKKEWEQYLSTLKTEVSPVEETLEIINLKMKIEKLQEEKSSLHKKLNTEIEIEKSVMLFHKLALDKEKITSQKIKEALIEIEETYKVIKRSFTKSK